MKDQNTKRNFQLLKPDLFISLFYLGLILFSWPLLTIPEHLSERACPMALFIYLFLIWGILIFVLFLINRGDKGDDPRETEAKK